VAGVANDEAVTSFSSSWSAPEVDFSQFDKYFSCDEEEMKRRRGNDQDAKSKEKEVATTDAAKPAAVIFSPLKFSDESSTSESKEGVKEAPKVEGARSAGMDEGDVGTSGMDDSTADMFESQELLCDLFSDQEEADVVASTTSDVGTDDSGKVFY